MRSKVCLGYFAHDRSYQILASAMLEFPINLYLHSLLFVLCLTWNKRLLVQHSIMVSGFKRSCVIDILHTSIYHQSEQMNQNNIRDDNCPHETSNHISEKKLCSRQETINTKLVNSIWMNMFYRMCFVSLTHFRPMFHLRINQVVCFTSKMFEKHLWKSDILSVKTNYLVST